MAAAAGVGFSVQSNSGSGERSPDFPIATVVHNTLKSTQQEASEPKAIRALELNELSIDQLQECFRNGCIQTELLRNRWLAATDSRDRNHARDALATMDANNQLLDNLAKTLKSKDAIPQRPEPEEIQDAIQIEPSRELDVDQLQQRFKKAVIERHLSERDCVEASGSNNDGSEIMAAADALTRNFRMEKELRNILLRKGIQPIPPNDQEIQDAVKQSIFKTYCVAKLQKIFIEAYSTKQLLEERTQAMSQEKRLILAYQFTKFARAIAIQNSLLANVTVVLRGKGEEPKIPNYNRIQEVIDKIRYSIRESDRPGRVEAFFGADIYIDPEWLGPRVSIPSKYDHTSPPCSIS